MHVRRRRGRVSRAERRHHRAELEIHGSELRQSPTRGFDLFVSDQVTRLGISNLS
jgi:hypothetical protein